MSDFVLDAHLSRPSGFWKTKQIEKYSIAVLASLSEKRALSPPPVVLWKSATA